MGFLDWAGPTINFDIAEYEHYEQVRHNAGAGRRRLRPLPAVICLHYVKLKSLFRVITAFSLAIPAILHHTRLTPARCPAPQVENGDLNWILPGKFVAFCGPAAKPTEYVGFRAMTPEDYWDYFR